MKVRMGFVTNSSSSSFIVLFDAIPQSMEELHKMMFPGGPTSVQPYDNSMSSTAVAERVWNDMKGQTPNDVDAMVKALGDRFEGAPDRDDFRPIKDDISFGHDFDRYTEVVEIKAKQLINKLLAKGKSIFTFSYADEDGESILEHGEIFSALEYQQISHH